MSSGFENLNYALLLQNRDCGDYFSPRFPMPCKLGIPGLCCESQNSYVLRQSNTTFTDIGAEVIRFNEQSQFLQRFMCLPSLRGFSMTANDFYGDHLLTINKEMLFPFFNLCRPEMEIKYKDRIIGFIQEPCTYQICKGLAHEIWIFDMNHALAYKLICHLLQPGILCILPFEKCSDIIYEIQDKNSNIVGELRHIYHGVINECCTKADRYGIEYPKDSTVDEKALITVSAILIDYLLFENF